MSSQDALETPVKNAFGVSDAAGGPMLGHGRKAHMCCSQPWLVKCHYCMPHHRRFPPCTYIIYTSKGRGRTAGGGAGGSEAELRGAHVQLRLAAWRDKRGGMRGAHATAGFDDYTLRRPLRHADRQQRRPHPSFAFTKPSGI